MDMENTPPDRPTLPLAPYFGITLATLMIAAIGLYALRSPAIGGGNSDCYEQELPPGDTVPQQYTKWEKPLVALVLSGQMHGYYDPCGCSKPQFGGLTRRWNFVQSLKARGWDVVGIDLGEMPALKGIPEQVMLKYEMNVKALATMEYRAAGIGSDEILLPLGNGLAQVWDKNRPYPRPLSLSLAGTAPGQKYHGLNVRPYEIIESTKPKIGVISMMGPDLRKKLAEQETFLINLEELPKALDAFAKANVEIGLIMHHEYPKTELPPGIDHNQFLEKERRKKALLFAEECAAARKKNPKIPPIHLMMLVTHEPEPPALLSRLELNPAKGIPTQIVEIGHKGKYVGLLGVYRDGKGYRFQYEIVLMSEDWDTKKGQEQNNAVTTLLEKYNDDLRKHDMVAKFQRTVHFNQLQPANQLGLKSTYVGSDRCGDCHPHAYKIWKDTDHYRATETLEKEKFPSGRQYDPECMQCHTTGYKNPGGYNDLVVDIANWPAKPKVPPTAKKIKTHNDNLRGVGCESCHGPGSAHVKDKDNVQLHALMNPQKNANLQQLTNMCVKCHDDENDVNFGKKGQNAFDKWIGKKMAHPTPGKKGAVVAPPPMPMVADPPIVIELIPEKKK